MTKSTRQPSQKRPQAPATRRKQHPAPSPRRSAGSHPAPARAAWTICRWAGRGAAAPRTTASRTP
ncbi:uncharacterized protein LY79DRAFT_562532 [Colletotrichum navitas]|uniref:Uncharacterized protein n=1 Tax=Colletotrichum navitas TaxID=681940 RepID=A0AAD8V1W7_9PEZI|nr:uncharacterized protein LY79DRAFT_562532 [Colletotrichum navitas]KAK1580177.1 hypothetical protein LY79DRAFT_562532 [Colletotrichum navitas]